MEYIVLNQLKIGNKIAVSIQGKGEQLKNGVRVQDENGNLFLLESVGMPRYSDYHMDTTELLLSGQSSEVGTQFKVIM